MKLVREFPAEAAKKKRSLKGLAEEITFTKSFEFSEMPAILTLRAVITIGLMSLTVPLALNHLTE